MRRRVLSILLMVQCLLLVGTGVALAYPVDCCHYHYTIYRRQTTACSNHEQYVWYDHMAQYFGHVYNNNDTINSEWWDHETYTGYTWIGPSPC